MVLSERVERAQQVPTEIGPFQDMVIERRPKTIVEIGTSWGGTIGRWLQVPTVDLVVSIDLPQGIHGGASLSDRDVLLQQCKAYSKRYGFEFYGIDGDSKSVDVMASLLQILDGRKIDFLFIDGDHTYEGVSSDFFRFAKLVADGGLIGFHDIIESEWQRSLGAHVDKLWNELKGWFDHCEFIDTKNGLSIIPESAPHGFGGIGCLEYDDKTFDALVEQRAKPKTASIVIGTCSAHGADEVLEAVRKSLDANQTVVNEVVVVVNYPGATKDYNPDGYPHDTDIIESPLHKEVHVNRDLYDEQLGFSRAYNRGIANAVTSSEYLILLNDDAIPYAENWIDRLVDQFYAKKSVGLVGPLIREDGCVPGFCLAISRKAVETCGMLCESFKMGYYEDDEFAMRVKAGGMRAIGLGMKREDGTMDYPMNHQGMKTFISHPERDQIIAKNKAKFERLFKNEASSNVLYLFVPQTKRWLKDKLGTLPFDDFTTAVVFQPPTTSKDDWFNDEWLADDSDSLSFCREFVHLIRLLGNKSVEECLYLTCMLFDKDPRDVVVCVEGHEVRAEGTWLAKFDNWTSMGNLSMKCIEELNTAGRLFTAKSILGDSSPSSDITRAMMWLEERLDGLGVMFAYPDSNKLLEGFSSKIIYTGLDSPGAYPGFSDRCNEVDFLLTPSPLSKERMISVGVKRPIFVVPHGIDFDLISKVSAQAENSPFTFLYCGECSERKGTFQLLDAFSSLAREIPCRLVLHSNSDVELAAYEKIKKRIDEDENLKNSVKFTRDNVDQREILRLMKTSHCYVYPSRADSFGMTVLEAVASGIPTIVSERGVGCIDFVAGGLAGVVKGESVEIGDKHPFLRGKWFECNVDDLKDHMKRVYMNYDAFLATAKKASMFVAENFNWSSIVQRNLVPVLDLLACNIPKKKIVVLVTSFERPKYLKKTLESLRRTMSIDRNAIVSVKVLDQSENSVNKGIVTDILRDFADVVTESYFSRANLGQRGALMKMIDLGWTQGYDYVCLSDHDNEFVRPLSDYARTLDLHADCFVSTGYLSREHESVGTIFDKRLGNIIKKSACRAGHMVLRKSDLDSMLPLELDSEHGKSWNSSWYMGLDWYLTWWHPLSPGKKGMQGFVYCLGGVHHIGEDSTWKGTASKDAFSSEELSRLDHLELSTPQTSFYAKTKHDKR